MLLDSAAIVGYTEDWRGLGYPDSRKVARDDAGALYVAFRKKHTQARRACYHVFVAKSTDGGASWRVLNNDTPIEDAGDHQRVPSIAASPGGALHVVWYGGDAASSGANERQIKHACSTDGGQSWSAWRNIAVVPGYRDEELWQEHPVVYAAADDVVYVAWQGRDERHRRASQAKFVVTTDGGASWSPCVTIGPSAENRSRPTLVAAAGNRTLYVLAYGGAQAQQQIVWACSTDGGASWSAWAPVAAGPGDQRHVSLAIDRAGRLHAAWREAPASPAPALVRYAWFDGRAWSAAEPIAYNRDVHQFFPSITVAGGNTVWAVWTESGDAAGLPAEAPASGRIVGASKSAGGGWSQPVALTGDGQHIFASLGRGRHDQTEIDLVWLDNAGPSGQIMYASLGTP